MTTELRLTRYTYCFCSAHANDWAFIENLKLFQIIKKNIQNAKRNVKSEIFFPLSPFSILDKNELIYTFETAVCYVESRFKFNATCQFSIYFVVKAIRDRVTYAQQRSTHRKSKVLVPFLSIV